MNEFKINKLTFKFQDLIIQNKMPALGKFKNEICANFIIFPLGQLEKIYAFIESIQKHPKRGELAIALKMMFKMLFDYMVSRDFVNVYHKKRNTNQSIKYENIFKMYKRKKIIQKGYKSYIIPYKPNVTTFIKKQKINDYYIKLYEQWNSFNLYEYEMKKIRYDCQCTYEDHLDEDNKCEAYEPDDLPEDY